jgi:hypothetical protein
MPLYIPPLGPSPEELLALMGKATFIFGDSPTTEQDQTFTHNLGRPPKLVLFFATSLISSTYTPVNIGVWCAGGNQMCIFMIGNTKYTTSNVVYYAYQNPDGSGAGNLYGYVYSINETQITFHWAKVNTTFGSSAAKFMAVIIG